MIMHAIKDQVIIIEEKEEIEIKAEVIKEEETLESNVTIVEEKDILHEIAE